MTPKPHTPPDGAQVCARHRRRRARLAARGRPAAPGGRAPDLRIG